MASKRKTAEYEQKIKELESALDQARQESQLIQAEAQPGSSLKPTAKLSGAARVDVVEHQALRQEVESLRKTVVDLQQELDHTNDQARQAEDQLEDKNTLIEDLRRDIEGLQEDVSRTETHRQKAEEARLQSDTKLSVLQERMEAGLGPLPQKTGFSWSGLVLGVLLFFVVLEGISFGTGRGELLSLLFSDTSMNQGTMVAAVKQQAPAQEAVVAAENPAAEIPAKPAAINPGSTPTVVPMVIKDGGSFIEDEKIGYVLVNLKGGTFQMGNRTGTIPEESPMHQVSVPPFLIGRDEVTFELYDRFAKATNRALPNDNGWGRGKQPVVNVSWEDAKELAQWLTQQSGKRYRLPTEAEWEYAASAGRDSAYWWGDEIGEANDNCFNCNSRWDRISPAPVDSFAPNPFGLMNTAGNVQEWVADCYRSGYAGAPTDGSALELPGCTSRVVRGGAFNKSADSMKRTRRSHFSPATRLNNLGIRLVREP